MNLLDVEQHSHEWFQARLGCCTGSRVGDALSFLARKSKGREKGESSQARIDYIAQLVTERLTGIPTEHYVTPAMQWGIENERYARAAYEVVSGNDVKKVGIAAHPTIPKFMASPDGLIGDDGLFEAKCPTSVIHMKYLMADVVPEEYLPQCLAEMACSGSQWVYFMSFDPRTKVNLRVFIKRVNRSDYAEHIETMEEGVRMFLAEVDDMQAKLEAR